MKKMNVLPGVIPGGCTSLLQPLDVCINKPLKDHAKKLWMVYMPSMNNSTRSTKPTTKQQIVEWVAGISSDMVVKSFKVTGLSNNLDGIESHMINENIIVIRREITGGDSISHPGTNGIEKVRIKTPII